MREAGERELRSGGDRRRGTRRSNAAAPGSAPSSRRRSEDHHLDLLVRTLARHLIPQPDLDDVAEFVCALLCGPIGAEEVAFAGRPDGAEVELFGQFPLHPARP